MLDAHDAVVAGTLALLLMAALLGIFAFVVNSINRSIVARLKESDTQIQNLSARVTVVEHTAAVQVGDVSVAKSLLKATAATASELLQATAATAAAVQVGDVGVAKSIVQADAVTAAGLVKSTAAETAETKAPKS